MKAIGDIANDLTAEDFAAAVEQTVVEFKEGSLIVGTVVRVDPDEVMVDIGFKSEGVIPAKELSIRNAVNPAEIVKVLAPQRAQPGSAIPPGEFTERVERVARIAPSHGSAFGKGGESFLRFNIATPRARVAEAVARLQAAFADR